MSPFNNIGNVPFDINVLASLFPDIKYITEKAISLVDTGRIIRLKKGYYVASEKETGKPISRGLVANHMYGPSYVSLSFALRHYGLIPERVYTVQSITTKHSRDFENSLGLFRYLNCSREYFHIGVQIIGEGGVSFLMATPEKALCDIINFSKGVNLRFVKDVEAYLREDIRFDMDSLKSFNLNILRQCERVSRKKQNIRNLIKFIEQYERGL